MRAQPDRVADYPENPYPGAWPDYSYVVDGDAVHRVESASDGWTVGVGAVAYDLDEWLADHGQPSMRDREPILSFGSNRCPSKVARQGGPMLNLRCRTRGLAPVWSDGTRGDGQVVATLVGRTDHAEWLFVSMCTPAEIEILDRIEGRGTGYDLVHLPEGSVLLDDGSSPEAVRAYVGMRPHRWPLADDFGRPILLSAMDQAAVAEYRLRPRSPWDPEIDVDFRDLLPPG